MFIEHDSTDELFYNEFLSESDELKKLIEDGKNRHFAYPAINEDLYYLFYKLDPKWANVKVPAGMRIAKQALDNISNLREFNDLRGMTKFDPFASGLATRSMSKQMINMLPKCGDKSERDIQEEINVLLQLLKEHPESQEKIQDRIKQLEQQAGNIAATSVKADSRALDPTAARQMARALLKNAINEVEAAQEALESLGYGSEQGMGEQLNLHAKMEMAKRLQTSSKLKEIAALAGRLSRIAKKKQMEKSTSSELSDIEQGDALDRVLPSQLMLLKHRAFKRQFFMGYIEKKLIQYKLQTKEPKGKGPIIVCVDGSGSMAGTREYSSKGIALALMEIAKEQGRDFAMIQFSGPGQIQDFVAKKGRCEMLDLFSELEFFFNGGTDFETPLKRSIKLIEDSAFNNADIIFITDGEAGLTPQFMESYTKVKETKQFSCYGILLGYQAGMVNRFCDKVYKLDDIMEESSTNDELREAIFKI